MGFSRVPQECFREDSFTLSYSILSDNWVSFHNYIPDFSVALRNKTLIQFQDRKMYQANVGFMGTFFGMNYMSYITPVFNLPMKETQYTRKYPFSLRNLNWNTDIENEFIRELETTWSSISLHNSYQGTQETLLVPVKDNCTFLEQYENEFNVRRMTNAWLFNATFNEKDSPDLRTWREEFDDFLVQNVEEKGCAWESLYKVPLRDDYVIVKLSFDNWDNKKLFFYDLNFDVIVIKT